MTVFLASYIVFESLENFYRMFNIHEGVQWTTLMPFLVASHWLSYWNLEINYDASLSEITYTLVKQESFLETSVKYL